MSGTLVKTILLQGGYYPDRFADEGRPPDQFFMSYDTPLWVLQGLEDDETRVEFLVSIVAECVDLIMTAIVEKYNRKAPPWEDVFWSCETRITKIDP